MITLNKGAGMGRCIAFKKPIDIQAHIDKMIAQIERSEKNREHSKKQSIKRPLVNTKLYIFRKA